MLRILVVTPTHQLSPELAIASARAGQTGVLDLTLTASVTERRIALARLREFAPSDAKWGLRWDMLADAGRKTTEIGAVLEKSRCPLLILAGVEGAVAALRRHAQQVRKWADEVVLEVHNLAAAQAAAAAGFDGVILKGHEAGGRVGQESSFLLLQRAHGKLKIPYWVQGGIGPDTATAAALSGATGVVLGEQLWLASESPLDESQRRLVAQLDGSETVAIGHGETCYRVFLRSGRATIREAERAQAVGQDGAAILRRGLANPELSGADMLAQVGQEIGFAARLAARHVNVSGILKAFQRQVQENLAEAAQRRALAPGGPLAAAHRTEYPVLQAPMTWVSDVPELCEAVSAAGGLPFLSLSLLSGSEAHKLLGETKRRMGERSWGVGIVGYAPPDLRIVQLEAIYDAQPPFAILSGAVPAQARDLEQRGIQTYLHVPSPGMLELLLKEGARKFLFEGRECGGHVGPRTSFVLWQQAIDLLCELKAGDAEQLQIAFAGGIHDAASAAMVASMAARLTAKGAKIGVLMGTAYLMTNEAVKSGAITKEFQRQALECDHTVLLEADAGHATRCAETPYVDEFERIKKKLVRGGKSADEVRLELELLNVGRLRIAAKGVDRKSGGDEVEAKTELVSVRLEGQRKSGLFMLGQAAGLHHRVTDVAKLHADVSHESMNLLAKWAEPMLARVAHKPARPATDDIAVVGMACMFPQADNLRQYWVNIVQGVDCIEEVPADRWNVNDYFSPDRMARDKVYSKWGGFLGKMKFDPMRWRIPPASLKSIEPLQLLSLEIAWRAMIDAGYDRREFPKEKAGVIFACAGSHELGGDYCFRTMMRHYLPRVEGVSDEARAEIYSSLEDQLAEWTEDSFPGFLLNVVAGRIAREFDFNGTNFVVDAACAASMAAVQTAVDQLRTGNADMMLVGGADATNNPFCFMSFAKTHALSAQGRSRPFDESADGIALGEGIGVMILKRLRDAERDGDKIYAVIKGVGSSSDGKNRSLTAPHPPGQIRAVERAYADAGVSPASVALFEAHGTGTVVGDAAELTTLTEVVRAQTGQTQIAAVGSVKSMIGHTKTMAGLASLIKIVLALKHRTLPPTIGVENPTDRVDFRHSPLYVNSQTRPWLEEFGQSPRRAGVSSFGFGGTNFHVVLEEYCGDFQNSAEVDLLPRSVELFVWRRSSREEIVRQLGVLEERLAALPQVELAQLAVSVAHEEELARRHGAEATYRLAIVADSVEDLRKKLGKTAQSIVTRDQWIDPTGVYYSQAAPVQQSQICFLYPGQGSQTVNMLSDLVVQNRWSYGLFAHANELLAEQVPHPLTRYIYPAPAFTDEDRDRQSRELRDTRIAQPALGLVELFATDLLQRYGIRPGMAAGHSYGEHVALHVAGCFGRDDLLWLSAMRGHVCAEAARTSPGGMAAVQADAKTTESALLECELPICLANHNSPDQTVIAGTDAAIDAAVKLLTEKGLRAKRIAVSAAFHSPLLHRSAEQMAVHFGKVKFAKPAIPAYSNTIGAQHGDDPAAIRKLLVRHFDEPVLWEQQVRQMHKDGARVFLEVGPGKVLSDLVRRILDDPVVTTIPLEARGRRGDAQLAHLLAQTAALGLPVEIGPWFENRGLGRLTVDEFFAHTERESKPKPTDWILSATGAKPVTPLPGRKPAATRETVKPTLSQPSPPRAVPAAGSVASPAMAVPAPSAPAPQPISVAAAGAMAAAGATVSVASPVSVPTQNVHPPSPAMPGTVSPSSIPTPSLSRLGTTGTMSNPQDLPSVNPGAGMPLAVELFSQFQHTTRMLFEMQRSQQSLAERYLDAQERLLSACMGQDPGPRMLPPAALMPATIHVPRLEMAMPTAMPTAAPMPAPMAAPVAAPVRVAPAVSAQRPPVMVPAPTAAPKVPAPAAPAIAAATAAVVTAPVAVAVAAPAPVAVAVAAPAAVAVAAAAKSLAAGPPPTEQFRQDLLAIVSERTGYPTDMLDEELPLEAGLGIDSIKTVEIFSKLKDYHQWFAEDGQDEEERLTEFTKLKTLRDIINSYDRRRESFVAGNGQAAGHSVAGNGEAVSSAAGNGAAGNGAPEVGNGSVERLAVTTAEAPHVNGSKKNSRKAISSS